MATAKSKRPSRKFKHYDRVLVSCDWGEPETKFVHHAWWVDGKGWVYKVGSIKGVAHRGGIAVVAENSLSKA